MTTKERPIVFTGESVRAILDGRKTQTRRVLKPQPPADNGTGRWSWWVGADRARWMFREVDPGALSDVAFTERGRERTLSSHRCPCGEPGDRLWVKETWAPCTHGCEHSCVHYRATDPEKNWPPRWRSPRFMPRWASRLTLEVTGVRVERLQDISEADCAAEGVEAWPHQAVASFAKLWDDINAKRAPWESNPWVWVVEFKRP